MSPKRKKDGQEKEEGKRKSGFVQNPRGDVAIPKWKKQRIGLQ